MEDITMNFGELIRKYVNAKDMSIADFARKINVSRKYANDLLKNKSNFCIQLVRSISIALEHNFFVDLANNPNLVDIPKEAMTIKMKDLSQWLIDYVYCTIHNFYCPEQRAKELNEWIETFSLVDAAIFVWDNSLLELKVNGIEDYTEVTIDEAKKFATGLVENIMNNWYMIDLAPIEGSFIFLNDEHVDLMGIEMQEIPAILKQEAIHNLQMELNTKEKDELRGQIIKTQVWVHPHCFPELVGIATINFDNDCNIIDFKFDTSESTL